MSKIESKCSGSTHIWIHSRDRSGDRRSFGHTEIIECQHSTWPQECRIYSETIPARHLRAVCWSREPSIEAPSPPGQCQCQVVLETTNDMGKLSAWWAGNNVKKKTDQPIDISILHEDLVKPRNGRKENDGVNLQICNDQDINETVRKRHRPSSKKGAQVAAKQKKTHERKCIATCLALGHGRSFDKYSRRCATRIRATVINQDSDSRQHVPDSEIRQHPLSAILFPGPFLRMPPSQTCIPMRREFSIVP